MSLHNRCWQQIALQNWREEYRGYGWQTHDTWCGLDNIKLFDHEFNNKVKNMATV